MIIGAHSIIYSTSPEADREFLRDVIGMPHVDVGQGWLIFGLPPAEVAVHPGDENDVHEFYLMCEDVEALSRAMSSRGIVCTPVQDHGWGLLTQLTLPGGGKLGIYQPRHARPKSMPAAGGAPVKASGTKRRPARPKPRKALRKVRSKPARRMTRKAARKAPGKKRR